MHSARPGDPLPPNIEPIRVPPASCIPLTGALAQKHRLFTGLHEKLLTNIMPVTVSGDAHTGILSTTTTSVVWQWTAPEGGDKLTLFAPVSTVTQTLKLAFTPTLPPDVSPSAPTPRTEWV